MKKIFITSIISLIVLTNLQAQECEAYVPTKVGEKLTYETTDKKGKIKSYYSQELLSKNNEEGGTNFKILHISYDENQEIVKQDTLVFLCKNNMFYVDMNRYLNEEQIGGYDETQIEITFKNIGYPANMKPGITLDDGYVEAKINAGAILTFRTDIQNRRVEAYEDISTKAGNFKTIKITADLVSKFAFMKMKMNTVSWIKMNIGNIRTESYDKKGKLTSVSELISIE